MAELTGKVERLEAEMRIRDQQLEAALAAKANFAREVARLTQEMGSKADAAAQNGQEPGEALKPLSAHARRRIALDLIADPETAAFSDREVARRAGVSPQTVGTWRQRAKARRLLEKA